MTVTWLVHDVEPWRVDRIYLGGKDGPWISTQVSDFSGAPSGRAPCSGTGRRTAHGLADLLDGLGLGTKASKDTSFDGVAGAPVPARATTASDETNAALPAEADTPPAAADDSTWRERRMGSGDCRWAGRRRPDGARLDEASHRTLPTRRTVVPRWGRRLRRGAGPLTPPVAAPVRMLRWEPTRTRVAALVAARSEALVAGDAARMKTILADDFTYTNASGVSCDRDEYVASYVGSPDLVWLAQESSEPDDPRLRRRGRRDARRARPGDLAGRAVRGRLPVAVRLRAPRRHVALRGRPDRPADWA